MNEFNALRARARAKRDKLIAHARAEYTATLVSIAALEQDLLGKESSRHKMTSTCINQVLPKDRPFSTQDVMAALEALDPGKTWRKRSVDSHIARLRDRGVLRRLKRATIHEPAQYVRVGVEVAQQPFQDMRLIEVMQAVLTRPMKQTELVVSMLESGYQSTMTAKALRDYVGRELRRGPFNRAADGKWALLAE